MQSPSPSPLPFLASSAPLSRDTSANESHDHVAHHGSAAAWPLIFTPKTSLCTGLDAPLQGDFLLTEPDTCGLSRDNASTSVHTHPDDVVGFVPSNCPITCDSPRALQNEEFENEDENARHDVLRSDNGASPGEPPAWSEATFLNDLPSIDPAHQTQHPAVQNAWVEGTVPQSSINCSLNVPGISYDPAIATSGTSNWSPQQTLSSPAAQNFTGFYNPSLILPQNNIHNPSLIQPQLFHTSLPSGPSFYQPTPITPQRTPCPFCTETFARSSDLNRHFQSVHLGIKYHCDYYLGCPNNGGKGYCRLEKLRTHQREKHGFSWS